MSEETLSERLGTHNDQLTNHLVGEVRTLLDAIISDERQAKAAKDMVRDIIWGVDKDRTRGREHILFGFAKTPVPIFPDWLKEQLERNFS